MQARNTNNISVDELHSIIDQKDNQIQMNLELLVYFYYAEETNDYSSNVYTFISLNDFNKLTTNNKELKDNEFIYFVNQSFEENDIGHNQSPVFPIVNLEKAFSFKESIEETKINSLSNLFEVFVVSDSRFEKLKSYSDGVEAYIDLINVTDWKKSKRAVNELTKSLIINSPADIDGEPFEKSLFEISSKVEESERNKASNGIVLFITTIFSIIFFFGSFILLYSNLVSDIEKEQERFKKLKNIGITSNEIKKIISKDIAALFFIPAIVGTGLAFSYIVIIVKDIGGILNNPEALFYFFIIAGVYHFIQVGFYLYARKRIPFLINK
jgi:ABC-type antimicrobial peptide transport system permease subunit